MLEDFSKTLETFFKKVALLNLQSEAEQDSIFYSLPETGPILAEFAEKQFSTLAPFFKFKKIKTGLTPSPAKPSEERKTSPKIDRN